MTTSASDTCQSGLEKEQLGSIVLEALGRKFNASLEQFDSFSLAKELEVEHDKLLGTLNSLTSKNQVVLSEPIDRITWHVTEEGSRYAVLGSPEWRLIEFVRTSSNKALTMQDIQSLCSSDLANIGLKTAMRLKWLALDKTTRTLKISDSLSIEDECGLSLRSVQASEQHDETEPAVVMRLGGTASGLKILQELKKRKLVESKKVKYYEITKGSQFSSKVKKLATDLTQEMILRGTWSKLEFKPYNFFAAGIKPSRGSVHPLIRVLKKFRKILFSMGFEEMSTDNWVESSFWNFDALFQPQQHPARDAQDTFFLKEPATANSASFPADYVNQVKKTHEVGGYGSLGWRYDWSFAEAEKNILRTHTTACSVRCLYKLAQYYKETGRIIPKRYFSIDRVFRNETLDMTHLAEFHQVEGVVCDKGIGLKELMGVISTFYKKIGITTLRFKPAYNPYTEPSMEIFGFHEKLNRWIEVGNSGIFRPEMLRPMGFPEDVAVLGWGLSLERPTMIQYKIRNIRELFGHKAVLGMA